MSWKNILKQELTLLVEPIKNKINSLIEEYHNTPNKPRLDPYGTLEINKKTKRGNMLINIKLEFKPEDKTNIEFINTEIKFTQLPSYAGLTKPRFFIQRVSGNWKSFWIPDRTSNFYKPSGVVMRNGIREEIGGFPNISEDLQRKIVESINQIKLP